MIDSVSPVHLLVLLASAVALAAAILAIVVTIRSRSLSRTQKIVWTILLIVLPVAGLIAWGIVRLARSGRSSRAHTRPRSP